MPTDANDTMADEGLKVEWLQSKHEGFGTSSPADELLHGPGGSTRHDVCETWWFEALVPERGLVASFYVAMRPNLNVCSAGAWIWRGHQRFQVMAEHLNYQIYVPMPKVSPQGLHIPQVGLRIDFVDPLQRNLVRYESPDGSVAADLTIDALFPIVMRSNGKHFEGATRVKGTLRLGKEVISVDSHGFRDRSWGESRPEIAVVHPPIGWLCGVVGDGRCAFNLSGLDDPRDAEWSGVYPVSSEQTFYDGWIILDGELRKVVKMRKRTQRNPADLMAPVHVDVEFEDDRGQTHRLTGSPSTSIRVHVWPNNLGWFGLTEWTLDGMKGWGECQDYSWADYHKRFSKV
ncbi:MAG TPA: hypothetical protein VJS42_00875 [Steroidobacteraceae bacterium]|nr:hypothetical protein [Steroidobacteraceae bacterium]